MLALVVLAALQAGLAVTGAGDGQADLEEAAQRGPLAQLRAEDRGPRVLARGGEQLGQGRRLGVAVVVEQPDPLVVVDGGRQVEAVAHGGGVAGRARDHVDDQAVGRFTEGRAHERDAVVAARGVDGHDAVDREGLPGQTSENCWEPTRPVMADE